MSTFAQMTLPPFLAQRLLQAGITSPTPIQQAAIPPALEGRDVMAQAKTEAEKHWPFFSP
jgi:ATP-dependent RNA helicase RhlE